MIRKCVRDSYVPLNPLPLVTPMMSIISSLPKTLLMGTFFSKCSRAKLTLSAIAPPLSWISTMCAYLIEIKRLDNIFRLYILSILFCKNIQRESSIVFKSRVFMCPYLFSSLFDKWILLSNLTKLFKIISENKIHQFKSCSTSVH